MNLEEDKTAFNESVENYYKLKDSYEIDYYKLKKNIIDNRDLSWKEKRNQFARLTPKCINCKRAVGTTFENKKVNGERFLKALCGDKGDPCPLNININMGLQSNLVESIKEYKQEINDYKKKIIVAKNDLLFNYINTQSAVNKFEELKKNIEESIKFYEYLMEMYENVAFNKEREEELRIVKEGFYSNVDALKQWCNEFNKTEDTQFIRDAVDIYLNEIVPKNEKIVKKEYAYRDIEYNETNRNFQLVEVPIADSIEKMEFELGEPQVISFQTGYKKTKKERKSTVSKPKPAEEKITFNEEEEEEEEPKIVIDEDKIKQTNIMSKPRDDESEYEEDNDYKYEDNEDEENEEDKDKITIHNEDEDLTSSLNITDLSNENQEDREKISASEANKLKYKIELENGELIATDPATGKKFEVIAGRG